MTFTRNKKATHDYTILEEFEAGIKLTGAQVKAVRVGNIQLKGSYVRVKSGELFMTGVHISKPSHITEFDAFNEKQDLKLLMKKKEILKLDQKVQEKGLTLVALSVYQPDTSNKIKVKIGLGKGNKDYDKRQNLKEKQAKIDTQRQMKDY